jgi:hypothetical protein
LIWNIIVTYRFGVGLLGAEIYRAPRVIKLFIQILSRFDPLIGVFLYIIISSNKKSKFISIILVLLLFFLHLLRRSFALFPLIVFFFIVIYGDYLYHFIRRKIFLLVFILIFITPYLPLIVANLYDFRSELRGLEGRSMAATTPGEVIIFGILLGRLSSYSNSAIIMERKAGMTRIIKENFSVFQIIKEAGRAIAMFGSRHEDMWYGNLMLESIGNNTRVTTLTNGTQGVIMYGYYHSGLAFIINILTLLFITMLTFHIALLISYHKIKELYFMLFCYTAVGGGAQYFLSRLVSLLMFLSLFLCLSFFADGIRVGKLLIRHQIKI